MKPAPFEYHRPDTIESVIKLLEDYGGDAKIIAGGQSLLPMLAFRLLAPSALVDICRVPDLNNTTFSEHGVALGARLRWVDIERDLQLRSRYPLLVAGVEHIAHYQIRNRGTIGGSLAHADPAAEFPALVLIHEGQIQVQGVGGSRLIPADSFFHGMLTTDLAEDEIITGVHLPAWPSTRYWSFKEFARRTGDFALAGVALHFQLNEGRIAEPRIVAFGIDDRPVILAPLQSILDGALPTPETFAAIGAAATKLDVIDPPSDLQASSDYRRAILGVLVERALVDAFDKRGGAR
ncbi:FAD binding domain-containing protein [Mesorhizobium sp. 1B3]|uniref:FAD binding domain-containing protein n=1 Tax=Mesorhizobium sp. 1B3 TaxID=3243599 RepID=UPI003D984C7C